MSVAPINSSKSGVVPVPVENGNIFVELMIRNIDPWKISLLSSLTLFLPLICFGNYDLMQGSTFQEDSSAISITILLACMISMTFPMFIDMTLDLIVYKQLPYFGYGILSILSIVAPSIISLTYQDTEYAGAVSQVK